MLPVDVLVPICLALLLSLMALASWFQRQMLCRQAEMNARVADLCGAVDGVRVTLRMLSRLVGVGESDKSEAAAPPPPAMTD